MRPDVRVKKETRKRKPALSTNDSKQSLLTTMTSRKLMKKPEVSPEALTTLRHNAGGRAAAVYSHPVFYQISKRKRSDFFREIPLLSTYCEYFNYYVLYCPFCWPQAGFG